MNTGKHSEFPATAMLRWLETENEIADFESLLDDFPHDAEVQQNVRASIKTLKKYQQTLLPAAEAQQWLVEIDRQPALKKELETVRLMEKGFEKIASGKRQSAADTVEPLATLPAVDALPSKGLFVSFRQHRARWSMALAAGLLLVCVAVDFFRTPSYSKYQQNLVTSQPNFTTQGAGSNQQQDFVKFEKFYKNGDFDKALASLLLHEKSGDAKVLFWIGIASLKCDPPKTADAIRVFDALQNGQSNYRDGCEWYLALAYWQAGNLEKSREWIGKIPESSPHRQEADELFDELKE